RKSVRHRARSPHLCTLWCSRCSFVDLISRCGRGGCYRLGPRLLASRRERFWTNALAQLTIVPAVVLGGVSGISWVRNANSVPRWEAVLLGVSTVLVSIFVFGFHSASVATTPAVLYFPLPLLLWAAVR